MRTGSRRDNVEFVERLIRRNPDLKKYYTQRLAKAAGLADLEGREATHDEIAELLRRSPAADLETIVSEERPVLFVEQSRDHPGKEILNTGEVTIIGLEAQKLLKHSEAHRAALEPLFGRLGRIDVFDFPGGGVPYVGTGWLVDAGIVVTNRHVAETFARQQGRTFVFRQGGSGRTIRAEWNTGHYRDGDNDIARPIAEVLYIEPESGPNDIAFLRLSAGVGDDLAPFAIAESDVKPDTLLFTLGYPAKASRSRIPDQELMKRLYLGSYDVKRFAPGYALSPRGSRTAHDCTTLGGNSGSAVIDMATGQVVGLHYAGIYKETNLAVPASELRDYVRHKRWTIPPEIRTSETGPAASFALQTTASDGTASITVPLTLTVSLGGKTFSSDQTVGSVEAAVNAFWSQQRAGVVATRVGYPAENGEYSDTPYIAVSVEPAQLETVRSSAPSIFGGYRVIYEPASVYEQVEALFDLEGIERRNLYDDDARTTKDFSFEPVRDELMTVRAHVSPEYGFDELTRFFSKRAQEWVSAMYEFRGPAIRDLIQDRLAAGEKVAMALDNKTFAKVKDEDHEFPAQKDFEDWEHSFGGKFERIAVPIGLTGLIERSYHIKVTVRDSDTFWLSSGNWKTSSSQPIVTDEERRNFREDDLPGNRDWHVVVSNPELARRFRAHILQDMKRSHDLGADAIPVKASEREPLVDVPESVLEAILEAPERRPPSRLLDPLEVSGEIPTTPLLTPDDQGAVYSEAVLKLIQSARKSLLFQIPYIGMRSNPKKYRGYIDDLIEALAEKLVDLDDARVLLRRDGNNAFNDPRHAAWYFKSKGVDVDRRLKWIVRHHTKGMVVDGKTILIGSHNWSGMGVTTNRDASLIFEDRRLAGYFADAFRIDWDRADPIRPRRYVREEAPEAPRLLPADMEAPERPGYRRMRLSEYLSLFDE